MSFHTPADPWATTPPSPNAAPASPLPSLSEFPHKPGSQLGSYELLQKLGGGGMGVVYRVRHVHLKKEFALKLLSPKLARDEAAALRFRRETEALGRLEDLHLVSASDAGVIDGAPFLVMELLDGADLAKLTAQRGPWPVAEACEAIRQAALGLQHAHERGLVHRDIKPSNLWLTPAGVVKVLDLGLARLCSESNDDRLTEFGQYMGTPDYIAPEQILDSHSADIRADLYSLGCTLCYLLTGAPPFGGAAYSTLARKREAHLNEPAPDVSKLRLEVPTALAAVVAKLLAKRPEGRYATPAEAALALAPFAADIPRNASSDDGGSSATPVSPTPGKNPAMTTTVALPRSWHPRRWLAVSGVLLAGLVALLLFLLPGKGRQPDSQANPRPKVPQLIQVKKLEATLTRKGGGPPLGLLGEDVFDPHLGDTMTLEARLTRPAYAFLIVFRPDGKPDVCFPDKADQPPPLTDRPRYISPYGLDEGTGLEAIALVVSSEPLPAFNDWWSRRAGCPWKREKPPMGIAYRANGEDPVDVWDEKEMRAKDAQVPGITSMGRLAIWLRKTPGIETVQVLGFVVVPTAKR